MRYFIFTLIFLGLASSAQACMIQQPLTEQDMNQAQTVFIGKAVRYEKSKPPKPARITFDVEKILQGREVKDEITVSWIHGTFGMPETLRKFRKKYGRTTKVGILFPDTFPETCKMVTSRNGLGEVLPERELCRSDFIGSRKSEQIWVLNKPCSGPYMMAAE